MCAAVCTQLAEHFKAPMIAVLGELGIEVHGISQTERYTSGAYRELILLAVREREKIDATSGSRRPGRNQGRPRR